MSVEFGKSAVVRRSLRPFGRYLVTINAPTFHVKSVTGMLSVWAMKQVFGRPIEIDPRDESTWPNDYDLTIDEVRG